MEPWTELGMLRKPYTGSSSCISCFQICGFPSTINAQIIYVGLDFLLLATRVIYPADTNNKVAGLGYCLGLDPGQWTYCFGIARLWS